MFKWLQRLLGWGERKRSIRASYDAASTDDENRRHWADADALQADAVADPSTRQTIRDRARLEYRNDGYTSGVVDSLANDLVGTGPRPQVTIPGVGRDVSRKVEKAWANWAKAANLAEDLWLLDVMEIRDGEGFALFVDNPKLPESELTPVQLDIVLFEAEQVADPYDWGIDPLYVDGIQRDRFGNPVSYTFLETHPGGIAGWQAFATKTYQASEVLHWFTPTRAGQARGVSRLAPILSLGPIRRRWTKAALMAAELHACIAGVLKTNVAAPQSLMTSVEATGGLEIVRNMLMTIPDGWDASAFKAEQPTAQHASFKRDILNEMGRPLQSPLNVISADSSSYNYSSAKLDERLYARGLRVKSNRFRLRILDRIFMKFIQEAALAGAIPPKLPAISEWSWTWHFDEFASIDREKDAKAAEVEKRCGLMTDAEWFASKGQDWEEVYEQLAREQAKRKELGLPEAKLTAPTPAQPAPQESEGVASVA